jgi:hypothetical protein
MYFLIGFSIHGGTGQRINNGQAGIYSGGRWVYFTPVVTKRKAPTAKYVIAFFGKEEHVLKCWESTKRQNN